MDNLILKTDSYKLNHWNQYPQGTEGVYSYFEARPGAKFPYTVFFGLQYLIDEYLTRQVTWDDLLEAREVAEAHMGPSALNDDGWRSIILDYDGYLPLRIKAVPEGTRVPTNNVIMTVENTDPEHFWLTNYMESLLLKVWYPSTVATLSTHTIDMLRSYLVRQDSDPAGADFMLHDFGYRGVSSEESAAIGGAAHLISSRGTDTLQGMQLAREFYGADLSNLAFSVPATEHSIMTALGKGGEFGIVERLLDQYPTGILSVVADSYNIYDFVDAVRGRWSEKIMARDGVFVVRPDSTTRGHTTPESLVVEILHRLWNAYTKFDLRNVWTQGGYKLLPPQVRVLWGDGIDPDGIKKILDAAERNKFAAENLVFGMGGGLLQKVNRDTQRFAFKCSAQKRNGEWINVNKTPLDESKKSKAGRLALVQPFLPNDRRYITTAEEDARGRDQLITVFENGEQKNRTTFDEIRSRCATL